MKVLYIGVYRDGTGWSRAAIDYMLALRSAGADVVARPIKLNNKKVEIPEAILEMEQKDATGCEAVIQHVLPHMMDYNGKIDKNVALYVTETTHFKSTNWANKINFLDEAWVPNQCGKQASIDSGVNIPIKIVPHACDINKYQQSYEPITLRKDLGDDFVFYTIGEANRRKHLAALIKAYHLEFEPSEQVRLLIKTSMPGYTKEAARKKLYKYCEDIKHNLKLYHDINQYSKEIIITERLSEEDMMRLHASMDCYVSPSFGEAWGIPAFDAMAMGKTPIVTAWGGYTEYVTNDSGWLIPYRMSPVFGMTETFQDLYTGHEQWADIDVLALCKAMREAYENKELRENKAEEGMDLSYNFSYEKVGEMMMGLLND